MIPSLIQSRRDHLCLLSGALTGAVSGIARAADASAYTDAQKEKFLASAKIVSMAEIGHGVTKPVRAELEQNGTMHSASFQTVDKQLPDFFPPGGKPIPMRDSWRNNIAAYRVDRLLDLNMVVATVARPLEGKPAAISWWADDVMFEEADRVKQNAEPPNPEDFDRQMALTRVFDELIINIDRNLANLLITKSWKLALIDHSRSFVPYHGIRDEENLTRCSRRLLANMKRLTVTSVARAVGPNLTAAQVQALLARRDRIVGLFAKRVTEKGEANVMFS